MTTHSNNHLVVHATDATFDREVLQSPLPVLVDFWAPWCGPCRIVGPIVEELAQEYAGKVKVVKLNTDDNQETAAAYGIRGIPTLAIFVRGQIVDGIVGAAPKKMLKEKLDTYASAVAAN
jgi:thioredoxin 1